MRAGLRFAGVALLALVGPPALAQQPVLRVLDTRDGLSHSQVWSSLEDRRGLLWFATSGGLSRFDGRELVHFGRAQGLHQQTVRVLLEDAAGALWLGTDAGLARFDGRHFEAWPELDGAPLGTLWGGTRDADGTLWFASDAQGLLAVPEAAMPRRITLDVAIEGGANALLVDRERQLWLSFNQGRVLRCPLQAAATPGPCTAVLAEDGSELAAHGFVDDPRRGLLLAEYDGQLWRWDGQRLQRWRRLPTQRISGLALRSDGALLVATSDVGLFVCTGPDDACTALGRAQGLPSDAVYGLTSDRQGQLWLATDAGAVQWSDPRARRWPLPAGFSGARVLHLREDAAGEVWLGSLLGLLRLDPGAEGDAGWTALGPAEGLPGLQVWATHQDQSGRIWILTDLGPCLLQDDRCQPIAGLREPTASMDLAAIAEAADGTIWLAGTEGVAALRWSGDALTQQHWRRADGMRAETTYALAIDRHQQLWLGTTGGLHRLQQGRIEALDEGVDAAALDANALLASAGGVWLGSNGHGLWHLRWPPGAAAERIRLAGPDTIADLRRSQDGRGLWLSAEREGLLYAPTIDDAAGALGPWQRVRFAGQERLHPWYAMTSASDGGWWVAGGGELHRVYPQPPQQRAPPQARLRRVEGSRGGLWLADFEPAEAAAASRGEAGFGPIEERLRFRFQAPHSTPYAVEYSSRLIGLDRDWSPASQEESRDYTYLPPGDYRFEVRARFPDGAFGATAALPLHIAPAWWQQTGFRVASALALLGLLLLALRWRLRALARRNRMLESLVDERTAALALANERALQAERSKRRFLAGMTHELRTPLMALLGFARMLLDRRDEREVSRYARNIYDSGDELLNHLNNMLDYARLESGQMHLQWARVNVETVLQIACAMMEGYAVRRAVRIELQPGAALPEIETDPTKLRQVLLNLLSNAVKFSLDARPVVEVSYRLLGDGADSLPGGSIEIAVRDFGIGMAETDIALAFDAFVQLPGSSSDLPSSGLGLAVVRQLVELLGGRIRVDSQPGAGACFRLQLPLQRPSLLSAAG